MRVRRWVIGVAVVVSLAACGSDTTDDGDGGGVPTSGTTPGSPSTPPPTTSPTTPPVTDPTYAPRPTSVSVVRGGGIRPTRVSLLFAEGQPPPDGHTSADTAAVLSAAGAPALRTTGPTIGPVCCDQYVYAVTIHWSDGKTTRFTAAQGAIQPPALARLISLAESP